METQQDLEEVRQLLVQARRENTKRVLSAELARLEAARAAEEAAKPRTIVTPSADRVYTKRLTEYAWDQSDKFVKFYVTLKNVQTVPESSVTCTYAESSFTLTVEGLDNKNYTFSINDLLKPFNTAGSKVKVKQDMVLLMLAKTSPDKWSHVTRAERTAEDAKAAKYNNKDEAAAVGADPTSGIMDMMKKMYDEGDDEMKRTIKKAWTESRDKQSADGMPGMPGMPML